MAYHGQSPVKQYFPTVVNCFRGSCRCVVFILDDLAQAAEVLEFKKLQYKQTVEDIFGKAL
jgi:hypothetical protein